MGEGCGEGLWGRSVRKGVCELLSTKTGRDRRSLWENARSPETSEKAEGIDIFGGGSSEGHLRISLSFGEQNA